MHRPSRFSGHASARSGSRQRRRDGIRADAEAVERSVAAWKASDENVLSVGGGGEATAGRMGADRLGGEACALERCSSPRDHTLTALSTQASWRDAPGHSMPIAGYVRVRGAGMTAPSFANQ